jgi:hypothetical protein
MNDNTRAALVALAQALAADPEACSELAMYGDLPEHLGDAVSDLVGVLESCEVLQAKSGRSSETIALPTNPTQVRPPMD